MAEATTQAIKTVPKEWPGAFKLYKHSKQAVMTNIWPILGVGLTILVVNLAIDTMLPDNSGGQTLTQLLTLIFNGLTGVAMTLLYLYGARDKKLEYMDSITKSVPFWTQAILLNVLMTIIAIGSFLLFIIPFFIVMPRLSLVTYYLVDKKLPAIDSVKASWAATQGMLGRIYGIFGVNLLMFLLCLTIIGIPVAIYLLVMYSAATVILYEHLRKYPTPTTKS